MEPDQFDLRGALDQLVRANFDEAAIMGAVRGAATDPEEIQSISLPLDSRTSPWLVSIRYTPAIRVEFQGGVSSS